MNDPLAPLASAWRSLTPPDPTAAVDAPDAATRATIDWLRAAWSASAPATPRALPWHWRWRLRVARTRRSPALPLVPFLAVAATLLLALTLRERPAPTPAPPPVDSVCVVPDDASPRLVSISADRMELRSGPVRLILFTPSQESNP